MMRAYLKIFIESLNAPITEKEFIQGLIKGIKRGKLIDHFVVLDTLSLYETDIDLLKSNMPYVAEVGFMNKDIAQKERFVIRVRSILKEIFDNMDKRLAGRNSLIFLKDKISSSVSANIRTFIVQSSSLEDLKRLIK